MKTLSYKSLRGSVLITLTVILVAVMVTVMAGLLKWASSGHRSAVHRTRRSQMLYDADAGVNYALASLKTAKQIPDQILLDTVTSSFLAHASSTFQDEYEVMTYVLTSNSAKTIGLRSAVREKADTNNWLEIVADINWRFQSIFDWGVFYDGDLEIHAARPLSFVGGIHCNGDMYVSCFQNQDMHFDSQVTVAGDILHERKEGPWSSGGNVYFKDNDDVFQPMKGLGNIWLDSQHPFWTETSLLRWDGNVLSKDHGVEKMDIPIPGTETNAHRILELPVTGEAPEISDAKYANKATLKILPDGIVYGVSNVAGTYEEYIIGPVTNMSWAKTDSTFWNGRQNYMINPIDIDIEELNEWVEDYGPDAFLNDDDYGGIFYVALSNIQGRAVRLINGEELPGDGLTVVTPNPMYVQGNYNTVDKKPASLFSDSFTMLSVAWSDDKNTKSNNGKARDTILNAAVVSGHVPSQAGLYSGGLENLIRHIENWGAQTFTMKGALISIWFSQQETINYDELNPADVYYAPPERIWSYDSLFGNPGTLPPGTPGIWRFELSGWKRVR